MVFGSTQEKSIQGPERDRGVTSRGAEQASKKGGNGLATQAERAASSKLTYIGTQNFTKGRRVTGERNKTPVVL